ncbi:hypothetical protein ACVWYI_005504 [Bradyrhizobium sp. LB13.1]
MREFGFQVKERFAEFVVIDGDFHLADIAEEVRQREQTFE